MIATELLFLKYSRSDEYQADELGFNYALKAGYNSGEMVTFFSTLERMTISEGGAKLPNFLSTHPLTPKRIERVKQMVQAEDVAHPGEFAQLKIDRNDYLGMVNGLVYGDNPRQGYVEGNAFYHPDMGFYFNIPYGWKVNNTPRQVTMTSSDDKAIILLQSEETTESLENYSKKLMKNLSEPKVIRQGYQYVNGLDAFHSALEYAPPATDDSSQTQNSTKQQKMDVNITCIRKSGTVFSFFTLTSEKDYRAYSYDINQTINSFRTLTNSRYINRNPKHVYVKQVGRSQTLSDYLSSLGIPGTSWDRIALMNAMQLNTQLSPNQYIKVIQ
jgi:predicted Zn-dependent protease